MKRRLVLSALWVIVCCIITFALSIEARAASENSLTFELNSDGQSYSVSTCTESADGALAIPATHNGLPVTSIGDSAFRNCDKLTSITIPNSVTLIGDSAFYSCDKLCSITIPSSVINIGRLAFRWCKNLSSITLPNGMTNIGEFAFADSGLTNITISNSITSIGDYAFYCCVRLENVYITDIVAWCNISFSTSYANPLYYADKLYLNGELITDLVIPDGVSRIGDCAFYHYPSLTSIAIPNSVTSIGNRAFLDCDKLTSITIPASVTSIADYAFSNCRRLTNVTFCGNESSWNTISFGSNNEYLLDASRNYHSYAGDCDKECEVCGGRRCTTAQHNFNTENICSICGAAKNSSGNIDDSEAASHIWDNGIVTKPASCKESGIKTFTCTSCNTNKTEAIAKLATHTYDNACDTSCNVCGFTHTINHTPGPAATATTDQTCTICGEVLVKATGEATATPPPTESTLSPSSQPAKPETQPSVPVVEPTTQPNTESSGTDTTPQQNQENIASTPTKHTHGSESSANSTVWVVMAIAIVVLGVIGTGIVIWKKKH